MKAPCLSVLVVLMVVYLVASANVSLTLGSLFLVDIGMLLECKWAYMYSLDFARLQHCIATLYLYLLYNSSYEIKALTCLVTIAFIVLCKFTIRVQSVDIAILIWFCCVYYTTNSSLCQFCVLQILIIATGLLAVWYCLYYKHIYKTWAVLLICHLTLTGPDGWTGSLFVLNKACMVAAMDIIPVTVLHIAVLLKLNRPEEEFYGVLDLTRLQQEMQLLPALFQRVSLDITLYFLRNRSSPDRISDLQQYLCELSSPSLLSSLSLSNRDILKNSLLTHPDFRFLLLLYRSNFSFLCWETNSPPLPILLRRAMQDREAALMNLFLQKYEGKLGLLWLWKKREGRKMRRLSGYLMIDILEYF